MLRHASKFLLLSRFEYIPQRPLRGCPDCGDQRTAAVFACSLNARAEESQFITSQCLSSNNHLYVMNG
jgi:hypothetical protein